MESLEKLRGYAQVLRNTSITPGHNPCADAIDDIADEIEGEIDSRYMELPVDADGVPIHVGDKLETFDCPPQDYCQFTAFGFTTTTADGGDWYVIDGYDQQCDVKGVRHVKLRTLEDVLIDAMQFGFSSHACDNVMDKAREFADEIRELLKEGGQ